MQKIILTEKTMGVVIDRLRKVTSGFYNIVDAKNVHPLRCKSWQDSGLADRTACADIKVHWMFRDVKHPIVSDRKKNEPGFPMIHMAFDAECAMCFSYGDVFYFKGNQIIINQTAGSMINCEECRNIVTKIVVTKYLKNMTSNDFDFVQQEKLQAEMSAQAWQEMADDTANSFHEFWGKELYA